MIMVERSNPVADSRLFYNVYVCRNCNTKIRVSSQKVLRRIIIKTLKIDGPEGI